MTKTREPIRIGLAGCGRVTRDRHLPVLTHLPESEVVALADVDQDRLRAAASQFHIPHCHPNFHGLLEHPEIEVIGVCVPAQFHVEVALAALDAGKHVFIEKPLSVSLDECDRIIERAARSDRKVMVGFNQRWNRLVRQAKRMIQQGTLGTLHSIRTAHSAFHVSIPGWRTRRDSGGGVIFEQASHHFDLWRFLLASEVETVFAETRSGEWEDESASVAASLSNGVVAASFFTERSTPANEVEVYGRDGRLLLSCYRFDGLRFEPFSKAPGGIAGHLEETFRAVRELPGALPTILRGGDHHASFREEWRHLIHAIRNDTAVECTLQDGKRAVEIVLAALQSAATGQPVKVAQAPRTVTAVTAART